MVWKELEDVSWFPKVLRDQQLGYIGWLVKFIDLYHPIDNLLSQWIAESQLTNVQDLCSGSGEPMISLSQFMPSNISISYSDKFPPENISQFIINSSTYTTLDVLNLDVVSDHFYTMFNAFHHFESKEQAGIISSMVNNGAPFCFIEILQPNIFTMLKVVFVNTIGQLLLAPFVRPFSWIRLLLTYIIPINLFTTTYDGIISVLKSKNKRQYKTLLKSISTETYKVDVTLYNAPFLNQLVVIRGRQIKG